MCVYVCLKIRVHIVFSWFIRTSSCTIDTSQYFYDENLPRSLYTSRPFSTLHYENEATGTTIISRHKIGYGVLHSANTFMCRVVVFSDFLSFCRRYSNRIPFIGTTSTSYTFKVKIFMGVSRVPFIL